MSHKIADSFREVPHTINHSFHSVSNKTLIVIFGPTAVGKTALSLQLASALRTEIVNVDSRQIYRDIPIGTAAPTREEMQRVKHHFVGILPLEEYYSAARFEKEALEVLQTCLLYGYFHYGHAKTLH